MTVGVDVEETATTRTRDDVSFSHCDGSSVTVAPPFRDSGHREIALALDPNLHLTEHDSHFCMYYTSSKGTAEETVKELKTRIQNPGTNANWACKKSLP